MEFLKPLYIFQQLLKLTLILILIQPIAEDKKNSPLIHLRNTNFVQLKEKYKICGSKRKLELHHINLV